MGATEVNLFHGTLPPDRSTDPAVPIFDAQNMLNAIENDRQLAVIIIQSAMGDIPGYFLKLERALAAGQRPEAERVIHTMKGLIAQLGGVRLATRLKEANDRLKAGAEMETAGDLCALRADYQQLADVLMQWMRKEK